MMQDSPVGISRSLAGVCGAPSQYQKQATKPDSGRPGTWIAYGISDQKNTLLTPPPSRVQSEGRRKFTKTEVCRYVQSQEEPPRSPSAGTNVFIDRSSPGCRRQPAPTAV